MPLVAACALAIAPATADAHTPAGGHAATAQERFEVEALGAAHVAEHERQEEAAAAEQRRLAAMSAGERAALRVKAAELRREIAAIPPEAGGAWGAPFPNRSFAIHAALLPTGKVLFWSLPLGRFATQENEGLAWLWDPARGEGPDAMTIVDPPLTDADGDGDLERAPLYCSGESFLPDGRLLVTGGNRSWPQPGGQYIGWEGVFTFNPWNETWARQADMAHGRWYPSNVLLGDGRTLVVGGYDESPQGGVRWPEIGRFTPSADVDGTDGVMENLGGTRNTALYPHLFTMPDGDVLLAGPNAADSAIIDPDTGHFTEKFGAPDADGDPDRALMSRSRIGGTAVLRPDGPDGSTTVTNIGGYEALDVVPATGNPATNTTETIDLARPGGATYEPDAPMHVARAYHNTVLLPDGGMVTVGGNRGQAPDGNARWPYDAGEARPVELLAPGAGAWTLGAAQAEDRGYHSVALLLPDGRVLSSGDDIRPDWSSDSIEIYSPPYLFKGPRPVIAAAPNAVGYGESFGVVSASPGIERAVLMAPSATTHGADMTQRHVELAVEQRLPGAGLNVRAPAHGNLAPPGWYMLFLVDGDGVPSVASWVRLGPDGGAPALLPDITSAPAQATVGRPHAQTVTVAIPGGATLAGQTVRYAVSGVSTAAGTVTTGADGDAAITWTASRPGDDTVVLDLDLDGDGVRDPGEVRRSVTVQWVAAPADPPAADPPPVDPRPVDTPPIDTPAPQRGPAPPAAVPAPPAVAPPLPSAWLSPTVTDGMAPIARLRVAARDVRRLRARRALRFTLSVDERSTVTADLTDHRRHRLGRVRARLRPGTRRLTLRLTHGGRPLSRARLPRGTVRLRVVVRDRAGNTRTVRWSSRVAAPRG